MSLSSNSKPDFSANWNVLSALENRRVQQQNNFLMQPSLSPFSHSTETINSEIDKPEIDKSGIDKKEANGSGILDLILPNLFAMVGLHVLGDVMHLESAIEEMKDVDHPSLHQHRPF